jgi:hypothetical protein
MKVFIQNKSGGRYTSVQIGGIGGKDVGMILRHLHAEIGIDGPPRVDMELMPIDGLTLELDASVTLAIVPMEGTTIYERPGDTPGSRVLEVKPAPKGVMS